MSREYNKKLSPEINAKLSRRENQVRRQKRILAISAIVVISLIVLLGSSIHAFASNSDDVNLYTYYESVQVEDGDTVWTIADRYVNTSKISKQDYVNEICSMNHLQNGQIHAGEYIIVATYSTDVR